MTAQGAVPHCEQAAAAQRSFTSSPFPHLTMAMARVAGLETPRDRGRRLCEEEEEDEEGEDEVGGGESNATKVRSWTADESVFVVVFPGAPSAPAPAGP